MSYRPAHLGERTRYRGVRLAGLAVGVVLALTVTGCGRSGDGAAEPGPAPQGAGQLGGAGTGDGVGSGATAQPGPTSSATPAPPNGGADKPAPQGGSGPDKPAATSAPTGPVIVYLRVQQKPMCPAGTTKAPIDGKPVVIEWKVTGSEEFVSLSVDGPGVYGSEYPVQGSEVLNFPCSGTPGTLQKHTYTLTAKKDGVTRTKTITVTAVINEIAVVP